MNDNIKAKKQLIEELENLRQQVADLEESKTKTRQAEETLRKWAHIFEHAEWGVSVSSGDTLEMVNPAYARMHGYTIEELIGKPIVEVYAPESRETRLDHIRIAHEKGRHVFEARHIRKDGTIFPAQIDVTVAKDNEGKVLYRAVNVQDLTERKEAEKRLAETSQALANIARGITDGIMLLSRDYKILWANEAISLVSGLKIEDLKGNFCYRIMHNLESPCQDSHLCPMEEVIRTGISQTTLHTHLDKDGKRTFVEVCAYPIEDKQDRIVQFVHLSKNVTAQKQVEEALRESEEKYRTLFEHTGTGLIV
ncbi:MAG: hypothetical protein C0407_13540, partial [Desulfobacca sp.]|nr:hypothetical protein [Desulfobacca sp.]